VLCPTLSGGSAAISGPDEAVLTIAEVADEQLAVECPSDASSSRSLGSALST